MSETVERTREELIERLMEMPELPEGVSEDDYTDYCTGADGTKKQPYPRRRNRQCSIGYHDECTDPAGERCGCPCHWLAAGSRPAPTQEQGWRPIESAPRDGTRVLLYGPVWGGKPAIEAARWLDPHNTGGWWYVDDNKNGPFMLRGSDPTHWLPLPAEPKEE